MDAGSIPAASTNSFKQRLESGQRRSALIRALDVVLFDDLAPSIGFRFHVGGDSRGILDFGSKAEAREPLFDARVLHLARKRTVLRGFDQARYRSASTSSLNAGEACRRLG